MLLFTISPHLSQGEEEEEKGTALEGALGPARSLTLT